MVVEAARVHAGLRPWASCVVKRESGGTLDRIQSGVGARNSGSSAQGRFQFINNDWNHGLPYMVADRLVRFGLHRSDARKIRVWLQAHPIYKWHGYFQQIGFLEVVQRGGAKHWTGHSCGMP